MKAVCIFALILTNLLYGQLWLVRGDNDMLRDAKEYSDEDYDIDLIMNMCNESFRIEMSYLESLNESGSFPDETDKTPKCYLRCVLENIGVVSEEGMFSPELASILFAGERGGQPMNDLEELTRVCAKRNETCKCERSYNFLKCLMTMEINKYLSNK